MKHNSGWIHNLFNALTSGDVSRNKDFSRFSDERKKTVHHRFVVANSLVQEARRLENVSGSHCWIDRQEEMVQFHLESPRLRYKRVVMLEPHEWEWLIQQKEIQVLFNSPSRQVLCQG